MRAWKRSAALLLALCMTAVLLVGCGEDPNDEDKLSVVMTGTVSTVDPALAATAAERTVVLHLFDNLYRRTADGVLPAAAQSHQTEDNEDGTQTYTFRLRSDAKWSDGTAVTAGDFVYAWKRLVSPDTGSPNRGILSMVAGYEDACAGDVDALAVSAEDDHTSPSPFPSPAPTLWTRCAPPVPPCRCRQRRWRAARTGRPAAPPSWATVPSAAAATGATTRSSR